jgi:protein-ribulosamine 3-kinase
MIENNLKKTIEEIISRALNLHISSIQFNTVGGGSINETYQIIINKDQKFFCKINSASKYPFLFLKEKNGLEFLAKQNIIYIPKIIACEEKEEKQILILEWIEQGLRNENFWKIFGEQLASLHKISWSDGDRNTMFGLNENNYMGALHQSNTPSKSWIEFFIDQRLEPQIKLALENSLLEISSVKLFSNLYKKLAEIFSEEPSSLLHGDLWSGNFLCSAFNQPVLIDPAAYFGNRNADLAMTTLFGGFDKSFYESYNYHFPFPVNYGQEWKICNLYPLLIHLNLFGKSYLAEIMQTVKRF